MMPIFQSLKSKPLGTFIKATMDLRIIAEVDSIEPRCIHTAADFELTLTLDSKSGVSAPPISCSHGIRHPIMYMLVF